jgi:hypothetical protein
MRMPILTTLVLGAFSSGAASAQRPTPEPLHDTSAVGWTGAPQKLDRPAPWLVSVGGTVGSAAGLTLGFLGGVALGQRVAGGRPEDQALGLGALGALIGSGLGTALGVELASGGSVQPKRAAQAAFVGMLAGITGWMLLSSTIDSTGDVVLAYSLPQGVVAGTLASAVKGTVR